MDTADTIAAISSAVGQAARMIVRLSGADARRIASCISPQQELVAGSATRRSMAFRGIRVSGWVYFFESPHSYSGEDVIEFHIPGNPLLARLLLDELISLGARQAEAGEFTARAFFHGRMNLSEAEGVAATISAQNERELRAARQLLAGELSRRLTPITESLADSLALVEVGIDFSEEDVTFLPQAQLDQRLRLADGSLERLLTESTRFEAFGHEPRIVLVGRPNAGKSTLLNALACEDRAIVSAQPGTTRDAIWSHARLRGGVVRIIDVAGLENDTADTADDMSAKMQQTAQRTIESADVVVLVQDITDPRQALQVPVAIDLRILTKLDLAQNRDSSGFSKNQSCPGFSVSAVTGQNMELLRERLDSIAFGQPAGGATLALNARHVELVGEAREALDRARNAVDQAGAEVVAMELRAALDSLGRIVGSVTPDDMLGRIFSSFCIGK